MEKYKKHQRVGVLVDVQNLFYSARHQYKAKVNFARLLDTVVDGRRMIRSLAYVVQTKEIDQSNFIDMLERNGYEVRSKDLKVRADGSSKGDWDMGIAVDAISLADRLDVIVIVSGDGDYVDLVNMLKGKGVRVEVASFPKSTAEELIKAANSYIPIEKNLLLKS
ncbi:NYN domain-containing protein [Candidatus Margulisiibacteriota bacterium]